jgi:hypothetical protein
MRLRRAYQGVSGPSANASMCRKLSARELRVSALDDWGDPAFTIFFEEIKRLGYVEDVNLTVERYSAGSV